VFAQNQLRRDTSRVGETQAFFDRIEGLDNVLASEANSIATSVTNFFAAIQTASDDPTSLPSRDAIMGSAEGLLNRINSLGDFIAAKESEAELQIQQSVERANSLIQQIGGLNDAITVASGSSTVDTPASLLNQRDLAILELSRIVSLEVRDAANQTEGLAVNLTSGESLVLADGTFNVLAVGGEPDFTSRQLSLRTDFQRFNKDDTTINVREENIGGGLGGLFSYREKVLEPVLTITNSGEAQLDASGNPISETLTVQAASGVFNPTIGGVELQFASGGSYAVGDRFLIQPTRVAAANLSLATERAEDWAFAKPIRVDANVNNLGDAFLVATDATNTNVDLSFTNSNASAFDGNGALQTPLNSPSPTFGSPVGIRFTAIDEYQVLDNANPANVITTVSGVTDLNNLIEQAKTSGVPAWPAEFAALSDYPGYDFSLQGNPSPGDEFGIEYNLNGINDNRNALEFALLQQEDVVRQGDAANGNKSTLNEAYASLVGFVGSAAANASVSLEAAKVMEVQSSEWFESTSGVSLDEEAANLIQFQQSYAAAAQILNSAREMFDTILAVAR